MLEASLGGQLQRVHVEDAEQEVVGAPSVELVEDEGLLVGAAIEPDRSPVGFGDDVGVGVLVEGLAGLAGAGLSGEDLDDDLVDLAGQAKCGGHVDEAAIVFDVDDRVLRSEGLEVEVGCLEVVDRACDVRPTLGIFGGNGRKT